MDRSSRLQAAPRRDEVRVPASTEAMASGASTPLRPQQGITPATQTLDAGELFEYVMTTPVTVLRHSSAMLPIINHAIEAQRISIYNPSAHAKHPLNGFRLHNNTPLYLMQGPITVFDGNAYAGDARIEDLAPGQDRLLSCALDLKTEVEAKVAGAAGSSKRQRSKRCAARYAQSCGRKSLPQQESRQEIKNAPD